MGEWKRVLLDPRRLGLLALMALLCAGLFMLSLLDRVSPNEAARMASANAYVDRCVEEWRGRSWEELDELAGAELRRLNDVYYYVDSEYAETAFRSDEEAAASISDLPDLLRWMEEGNGSEFYNTYRAYYSAMEDLRGEIEYLAGYGNYLENVQAQAELQSQTSLFGKEGSFSRRNLARTAEDFRSLLGVEVTFGNGRGVERWLDYELGDYFHLIAVIVIVLAFLEERKKGLWPTVRTTRGGRLRLGVTRIGILLAGSVIATALFTALPFVLSMALHGGWGDLSRSLQSVERFRVCPIRITVAEWLARFFGVKVLSGVLIGLLLWCVLGAIANPQFSVAALGATLAVEYGLYAFLPVQSALNGLKYFNLFAYVHTASLYTVYLNVDLFGFPVGNRTLALWGIAGFGLLFAFWALYTQSRRRPEGNRDVLGRIARPVDRALDAVRSRLILSGWEGYKALIFQYGVLLLALAALATGGLNYLYAADPGVDPMYAAYLADMEGPITEATDDYIVRARESAANDSENAGDLLSALDRVERRVDALRRRAEEGGYAPWVVGDYAYEICYGSQSRDTQRSNAAVAVTLTALLAAPLWAFERQSGVTPMLRSTPRGRRRLFRRKTGMAALLSAFVWGCVYVREMLCVARYDHITTLAAPVRNLDALASFPAAVTFGQYLAVLYLLRLVMLIGVGEAALAAGLFCPNVRVSYVIAAALLGLPALLTALGIGLFQWVSPLVPVASAELMWNMGSGNAAWLLPWLVWLAVAAGALCLARRMWCGRK